MKKRLISIAVSLLLLAGCASNPPYTAPPAISLEKDAWSGDWIAASPADQTSRGPWWEAFGDPLLNALQQRVDSGNLTLAAALFRHDQAVALLGLARAAESPTVDAFAGMQRNRQSDDRPLRGATQPAEYGNNILGLSASYEIDVWGRVRNQVSSARASAQAAAADMENVRLSLHASLAEHYVSLRGLDEQLRLFERTIENYQRALQLTKNRHEGGIASGLDVSRAQAQLGSARAQLAELRAQRAQHLHALAVLVGETPQSFAIAPSEGPLSFPDRPAGLPSALLQRRPDIAAAERRVAAAHAKVGVAQTAFYPGFVLGAQAGLQNAGRLASLLAAPNTFWVFGPLVAMNLIDGGARKAQVAQARAALDQSGAEYRATVLSAFQQVEDEMARLNAYAQGIADQSQAADAAERAAGLALSRYRDGVVTYLDVVNAQTVQLQAQRDLLNLKTRRLLSGVGLVRALGGGWDAHQLASLDQRATVSP